jgi:hypothetical protein
MVTVKCDGCGETKDIYMTEDVGLIKSMIAWLLEHWALHKFIYSETDLNTTFTIKTPSRETLIARGEIVDDEKPQPKRKGGKK